MDRDNGRSPDATVTQAELKACPFCGAGFKQVFGVDDLWSHPYNLCLLGGRQASAAVWNTRTLSTGDGWEPIETAPKDGTWFLAWQNGEIYPCEWRTDEPDEGPSHEGWYDLFNQSFEEPTHFMRLPSPPTQNGDNHE